MKGQRRKKEKRKGKGEENRGGVVPDITDGLVTTLC
jgi:hypothetical protein